MEYEELTEKIIGCAYKVYNTLGFGFLESVYENSLVIELKKAGLKGEQQRPINVYYDGKCVGEFKADIIVNDLIVLELKSVQAIKKEFEVPACELSHCYYETSRISSQFWTKESRGQTKSPRIT